MPLLLVAAAFQLFDSLQAVASGILRGVKDTRVPMLIALFSYWGVGLPVAYLLAFGAGWGGIGVWWGLALGLAAAALLLSGRFQLRDRLGLLGLKYERPSSRTHACFRGETARKSPGAEIARQATEKASFPAPGPAEKRLEFARPFLGLRLQHQSGAWAVGTSVLLRTWRA